MTIAIFASIWAAENASNHLRREFLERPLAYLKAIPAVESIDLYLPASGDVPQFDDGAPPALMIEIGVENVADAKALARAEPFQRLVAAESAYAAPGAQVSIDILETVHFPLPGQPTPPPRTAPLSFVVRYYGPNDDEAAFVRFYTEHHPLLLATFPGIRNVLCYLPPDWQSTHKVSDARVILGNEVVFDDLQALKRALASEVLPRLQEEGRTFARFGRSTHHAMLRERVYSG